MLKHLKINKYILLLLITLLSVQLNAQNKHQGIPFVKNYLPTDYNGNSQNWSIIEDDRGVMYFGNTKGILEFDGVYWNNINPVSIYTAMKDENGRIFLAGNQDYGYLTLDKIGITKFISLKPLLPDSCSLLSNFHTMAISPTHVYFGERGGRLHIYDHEKVTIKQMPFKSMHLAFIENNLYIASGGRLYTYNNNQLKELANTEALRGCGIHEIFYFNNKLLLVSRQKGLFTYDGKSAKSWDVECNDFLQKNQVYRASKINENQLAFGTVGDGVLIMDKTGKPIQHINTKGGMVNHDHCSIFTDSKGNIWSGLEHGISHIFINSPFTFYNQQSGLNNAAIYSIQILNNNLYLATAQGIMYRNFSIIDNPLSRKWRFEYIENNLVRKVWDIHIDENKLLTGFSNNGTFIIDEGKAKKTIKGKTPKLFISDNSEKYLICAKEHGGIFVLTKKASSWESSPIFENNLQVKYMAKDSNDIFWAFVDKVGLAKISFNKTFNIIDTIAFYSNNKTLKDFENIAPFNMQGKLYFGTKKGTYEYNSKTNDFEPSILFNTSCQDVFISKTVTNKQNITYFLGKKGDVNVIGTIHYKNNKYIVERISKPFIKLENFELSSLYPIDSTTFLMGCIDRLIIFDKNKLVSNQQSFNTLIRSVEISSAYDSLIYAGYTNHSTSPINTIKFKHNALRFKYAATFFDMPEKTKYSYLLEGHNTAWSSWSKKTEKEFSYLKKGQYSFKVKAKNIYGDESTISSYHFNIQAPWYNNFWSWTAYILTFLFIVRYVSLIMIQKERTKNLNLEALISERTEEIAAQRDEIMNINTALRIQQKDLSIQHKELSSHRQKILDSIDYAKQIQSALLPHPKQFDTLFKEYFIFFKPKDIVSGDFYWLHEHNDRIDFAVGDCTGHGVPGAFMSIMGISQMNDIIRKEENITPSMVLEELRKQVKNALNHDLDKVSAEDYEDVYLNSKVKDGIDIAFCSINKQTKTLQYAGANIPALIIRENKIIELKPTDNPIGIYLKEVPFSHHNFQLKENDIIYLYSDGYADQFGGKYNKKFYMENFKNLLLKIHKEELVIQNKTLKETMVNWQGNHEQIDDMVILGLKF